MPKTMICLPTRPMPVVMIDARSNPVVPSGGGTEHDQKLATPSTEDSAKAWARIDRRGEKPTHGKLPECAKGAMETKIDTYDGVRTRRAGHALQRKRSGEYLAGRRAVRSRTRCREDKSGLKCK